MTHMHRRNTYKPALQRHHNCDRLVGVSMSMNKCAKWTDATRQWHNELWWTSCTYQLHTSCSSSMCFTVSRQQLTTIVSTHLRQNESNDTEYDSEVNDRDQVFVDCIDTHANTEQHHDRPSDSDETDPQRSACHHNWPRPSWEFAAGKVWSNAQCTTSTWSSTCLWIGTRQSRQWKLSALAC